MTQTTTNRDDLRHLAQLTIDLDTLEQYYHAELPGRKPLCIVRNDVVPDELALTKFGEPVRFVSAAEARKPGAACLAFSKIEIQGDAATVEFTYSIEGIRGTVTFRKASGAWRVEGHHVHEQ